jgi:hypothetical protein
MLQTCTGSPDNNNNTFTWYGPSGVLGCIGQRRVAPAGRECKPSTRSDGCHAVPLNAAESSGGENLRGGQRLRLRFWKGCIKQHTYPFTLNRPLVASIQLCSLVVFGWPLGAGPVRVLGGPLSQDSPVLSIVSVVPLLRVTILGPSALLGEPLLVYERVL